MRWFLRAGVGRTSTAERSPGQGVEVARSDHTKELVWRHLNVVERECEIRCRLPRRRSELRMLPTHRKLRGAENPNFAEAGIRSTRSPHELLYLTRFFTFQLRSSG
jgi:hypothetical protein